MLPPNALPSPATSPSQNQSDLPSQPSRKRQRSQSMNSDASSSSLKRPVSDDLPHDLRSPRAENLSNLSIKDYHQDIDAYMEEQGEADISPLMTIPLSLPCPSLDHPSVPPADKLSIVNKGKAREMEIGQTWYLVARTWWKRWEKACTGVADKEGAVNESDLGPVDNSTLLDHYGNLRSSLAEGVDVEFVPEDVWLSLVAWYGPVSHPLPRRVVPRGVAKQASLELHPPYFKVARLAKQQGLTETPYPPLVVSSGDTVATLHAKLADVVDPNAQSRPAFRVWSLQTPDINFDSALISLTIFLGIKGRLLEPSNQTIEEAGIQSDDGFVVEVMDEQQRWLTGSADSTQINNESPIFKSSEGFFNIMNSSPSMKVTVRRTGVPIGTTLTTAKTPTTMLSNSVKTLIPGTLGLGNMGNTCFMNSALQCLAHNKELTEYFLSGVFEEELNPDNPLGMHGAIAEAFGALLQRIWASTGPSSYSPREFKQQLQRFAPQFSGYQQHDSQELVAFLLDGLHEDLNRVLKKPYVEKPDWEGGGDLELVQLANKSWEGYMLRNDSVIVDLFQGQYQSTLVCPECSKVSITFDPFMYLTLPLPIKKKWRHTIHYIPWENNKPHLKIPVEVDGDVSFKEVRAILGRWMNIPPDNLLTLEVFNHRFYKSLDDNVQVGDMSDSDTIVCYELPCHAQQSRTYKPGPDDPLILPVYLWEANTSSRASFMSASTRHQLFGMPMIVVLDRAHAMDLAVVYDEIIACLHRWTQNAEHLYRWEPNTASNLHKENGDAVTGDVLAPEEGDIVDQRPMIMEDDANETPPGASPAPVKVGSKGDIFILKIQADHKQFGTAQSYYSASNKLETWSQRSSGIAPDQPVLNADDALFCEFDENMKVFYFGDNRSQWDLALWDTWEEFIHPEYEVLEKASAAKKNRGLSLQDCLDEFTKEERLGEDDLWYCPRCKKHQQATKRFDLWKAPDILVVHLKRFSNSRTLRDKIDAFIDFPIEGLDLGEVVRERAIARKLAEQRVNVTALNLTNLDDPLIYDLFGVDEHIGGLGGGHYRAYALNHINDKWYHFDDSFVTPANPTDAVNANAYLLFYRRRTSNPLGGKTYEKVQQVQNKANLVTTRSTDTSATAMIVDTQLPTPPDESRLELPSSPAETEDAYGSVPLSRKREQWRSLDASPTASPSLDSYSLHDELQDDLTFPEQGEDPLSAATSRYDFPNPSSRASPTSSNEALADQDEYDEGRNKSRDNLIRPFGLGMVNRPVGSSSNAGDEDTADAASSSTSLSSLDAFDDDNFQAVMMDTHHEAV
ncbi:hypothetical protein AMATHDRAFT_74701 [Amanita thiersii Skay4041]|uniref:ubiquitinyl hydrolase 1 n=1 Tax=Amanita thiersii Skay4041 TaxID=703135 RepID=A0A2A9NVW1_9AGAR|nr:hypothetical protein AMATHDRAFT_74701 [Amanita thiersii Skay4041]